MPNNDYTTAYTVPELARLWHCSTDIVYDLLHRGELQGFRLGKVWRISDEARRIYESGSRAQPEPMLKGCGRKILRIT